jgi:hypothetical protein
MWQLLAQLNGMISQINQANSGYTVEFSFCSSGFSPNKRLPPLTGESFNRNPLYIYTTVFSVARQVNC